MSDDETRLLAARLLAASPFAMTTEAALAHIRERRAKLLAQPSWASPPKAEPDFATPEPMPVIDAPDEFAADFWAKRRLPGTDDEPPTPRPKKPRGRPVATGKSGHDRFRVIDGDKQG